VLPARQQRLAYFYFDRDQQGMTDTADLLRSIAVQLIQQLDTIREDDFFDWFGPDGVAAHESFQAPTSQVLENVVAALARVKKVVIVVDALDECEDSRILLELIVRLWETGSIDVLMSSRPSVPVKKAWDRLATAQPSSCYELPLSPGMNESDIAAYVTQTVDSLVSSGELSLRNPNLRVEIVEALGSRADGM
jgi:hypothetical protein